MYNLFFLKNKNDENLIIIINNLDQFRTVLNRESLFCRDIKVSRRKPSPRTNISTLWLLCRVALFQDFFSRKGRQRLLDSSKWFDISLKCPLFVAFLKNYSRIFNFFLIIFFEIVTGNIWRQKWCNFSKFYQNWSKINIFIISLWMGII